MAGAEEILRPSFLDRVTAPRERGPALQAMSARDLRAAVARDLEWLLNTRIWWPWEGLDRLEEAKASILTYGIPELSGYSWTSAKDARQVADVIERAIRRFEPRLLPRTVKCEVRPSSEVDDFTLRIRIEAVLHVEPVTEPVAFDAGVDATGGGLHVEKFE
jgi:type VI secretion system protein ImpF